MHTKQKKEPRRKMPPNCSDTIDAKRTGSLWAQLISSQRPNKNASAMLMQKKLILIGGLFTCSLLSILVLFISSREPGSDHSGFRRDISELVLSTPKVLDIQYNSYYLAGVSADQIYLGNVTAPLLLLAVDSALTITKRLSIEGNDLHVKATQITIDSSNFYMSDLMSYHFYRGSLDSLKARRYMYDSAFFAEAVPISTSTFAIRTFASDVNEYLLARETSYAPHMTRVPDLLQKQVDGLFCTDGMLHYDRATNRLVYLYFYRNQFMCMDTSLNLIYRANTIDTTSRAKIEVVEIESEGATTLGSPPLMVNKKSCVSGGWLFVNSNLMANNEYEEKFNDASVIDVYSLADGSYRISFYLPNFENQKIKGFMVRGDRLIAVYAHYLLSYRMNTEFFNETSKL
jgi:hypothetical protein